MKQYFIYAGLVAAGALAVATGGSVVAQNGNGGGSHHTTDNLNGFQEGPSIVTTGNGTLSLRIDTDANVIHYELTYSDLEGGAPTQAHIHIGSRAENGGVSAFLCGGSKPACPPSGTISGMITPGDVIGPTTQGVEPGSFDELVRAIRAGHTYANVHNQRWPGGEIRGQINNDSQRQFDR